jgi:hypothetical protein
MQIFSEQLAFANFSYWARSDLPLLEPALPLLRDERTQFRLGAESASGPPTGHRVQSRLPSDIGKW